MTRLQKVTRVAQIAEQRAEAATLKLAERMRGVASGEAQLGELNRFRNDYATTAADGGIPIGELLNRHRFIGRVDEAIAFQLAEVQRQERLLVLEQHQCGRVRAKSRALDTFVRRVGADQARRDERFEQGQHDERFQRTTSRWDGSDEGVDE